jgi:hypothetical protein
METPIRRAEWPGAFIARMTLAREASMDAGHHSSRDMSALVRELGPDPVDRIACYGEALRAMSTHVEAGPLSDAPEAILSILETAYDHLSEIRVEVTPEEFTLLVMSRLLARCPTTEAAQALQRGAVRYITRCAPQLPSDYDPIVEEARRQMRKDGDAGVLRKAVLRERARQDGDDPS